MDGRKGLAEQEGKKVIRNGYKKCNACLEELYPAEKFFSPDKRISDGLQGKCKRCLSQEMRKWRAENPERVKEISKQWRKANPEKVKEMAWRWAHQNPNIVKKARKREYIKNSKKINEANKKWRAENPEKVKEAQRRYNAKHSEQLKETQKRWLSSPKNRLSHNVSTGIRSSLIKGKGGRHWEELVDYTLEDLMKHLERLFTNGMSWENQGDWHIDHIRPISSFIFESYDDTEFKECWALNNLQPLWAKDNLQKHTKYINEPEEKGERK